MKKIGETCPNPQESIMWVVHTACEDEAKDFCKEVKAAYHPRSFISPKSAPLLAAHTGPGVLAIVFIGTHK